MRSAGTTGGTCAFGVIVNRGQSFPLAYGLRIATRLAACVMNVLDCERHRIPA
jgi:hypothetical protein